MPNFQVLELMALVAATCHSQLCINRLALGVFFKTRAILSVLLQPREGTHLKIKVNVHFFFKAEKEKAVIPSHQAA